MNDIRYALRGMWRSPAFTLTAILMLAVGIGLNATVFTVTNTLLFKGFPQVDRSDRIVYISAGQGGASYADLLDWRSAARSFDGLSAAGDLRISYITGTGAPESYHATQVTSNAFTVLGVKPIAGRDFTPADELSGAPSVAIISYGFWERRYVKDGSILGTSVRINGAPTTLIGVMPQGFTFPQKQDMWMPLTATLAGQKRDARSLWFAFGRLKDGVTLESARSELRSLGKRLQSEYPLTNKGFNPAVKSFTEFFIGPNARTVYGSMLGAVGFVLLIACANLANLMLTRSVGKSREISVRIALGAGRWRIARHLLIESLMLSVMGGMAGWGVALAGLRIYEASSSPPSWFDQVLSYSMDYRGFLYLVGISLATSLLFGLAPILRLAKVEVNASLRDGGRGVTGGRRGKHLATLLVTAEMALAVVLLAGAGIMVKSFLNIYNAKAGIKSENLLLTMVALSPTRYATGDRQIAFFDHLKEQVESIPGVEATAGAETIPTYGAPQRPFEIALAAPVDVDHSPKTSAMVITPNYFRTLGASIISGRDFNNTDIPLGVPTVIVNQRFATDAWPGESPIGKRLRLYKGKDSEPWLTVVGVSSNIVQNDRTRQKYDPIVYLPFRQNPVNAIHVFLRIQSASASVVTAFRGHVLEMDSILPVPEFWTLDERLQWGYAFNGSIAVLFLVFAVIALLLASIGLYAIVAHSVSQRTQEIGVRMATGATGGDILYLVFREGMSPLIVGMVVGVVASFATNRLLAAELIQVSAIDPATLTAASVALILSAALGCLVPAWRAMRVDPVDALRQN